MNIEQAKRIPIVHILDTLNIKSAKERGANTWYFSPWRQERTASFKVDHIKNLWFDHGIGIGGDVIKFACMELHNKNEAHTVADALRWLHHMSGQAPVIQQVEKPRSLKIEKLLSLSDVTLIKHPALINYLNKRGINLKLGQKYLKELRVYNKHSKKHFFALGFTNEDNGYEIRNPFFKGCLGTKTISFIRGETPKPNGIHLFEGFMDYLSALEHYKLKVFKDDAIILNSLSCLQSATPYIANYGYRTAYSWMDNDDAGLKGLKALNEFFKTQEDLKHRPMNALYRGHKDVNAWHMYKLGL